MAETLTHTETDNKDLWDGGKAPFKASYGKLMMWYFLLSDAFTFAGFLIAYGTLRVSMDTWPIPDKVFSTIPDIGLDIHNKPLYFVTFMTFVLLFSSYTMVRAVQEGHQENQKGVAFWMFLTIVGGAGFLGCQAWEWNTLINLEHMSITRSTFGTHGEAGVYLDENGKPNGEAFGPETSYLLHKIDVSTHDDHGHGDHGDHSHGDAHGAEAGHGDAHGGHHYAAPGDYKDAYVDEDGFIHRKFMVTEEGSVNKGQILHEPFGPKAFGALFFFITGFHGFHVASGLLFLLIIMINVMTGLYIKRKNGYEMVEKIGLYWHFVDLVWVFVFLVFYLL